MSEREHSFFVVFAFVVLLSFFSLFLFIDWFWLLERCWLGLVTVFFWVGHDFGWVEWEQLRFVFKFVAVAEVDLIDLAIEVE